VVAVVDNIDKQVTLPGHAYGALRTQYYTNDAGIECRRYWRV